MPNCDLHQIYLGVDFLELLYLPLDIALQPLLVIIFLKNQSGDAFVVQQDIDQIVFLLGFAFFLLLQQ